MHEPFRFVTLSLVPSRIGDLKDAAVTTVFMNTVVTRGRIEAVVTATGMHTEMGRLAGLFAQTAESSTTLLLEELRKALCRLVS